MHTAQNKFMAHVFHCEPSAGPLCKTIEAACKVMEPSDVWKDSDSVGDNQSNRHLLLYYYSLFFFFLFSFSFFVGVWWGGVGGGGGVQISSKRHRSGSFNVCSQWWT